MKSKKYLFDNGSLTILHNWWKGLENNRQERALLRRAKSATEVVFSQTYHELLGSLQENGYTVNRKSLAVVAGLLAHIKVDLGRNKSLAEQMASPKGDNPTVSELRFRRLLAVNQNEELYPFMIRIIRLLDSKVNLLSLACDMYWWNEKTRKDWAYDYYKTATAEK